MKLLAPTMLVIFLVFLLYSATVSAESEAMALSDPIQLTGCYVQIPGSIDKHTLDDTIAVSGTSKIDVYCTLSSTLGESKGIIVSLEQESGLAGESVDELTYLVMPAGHSEELSFRIPVNEAPEESKVRLFVIDENNQTISNSVHFSYSVAANNGQIKNLVLDKSTYSQGEKAKATVSWDFEGQFNHVATISLDIAINDESGNECFEKENFEVGTIAREKELELKLIKDCVSPTVTASLLQGGAVLDTKSFTFEAPANETQDPIVDVMEPSSRGNPIIYLVILVLVIAAVVLYLKKFKK